MSNFNGYANIDGYGHTIHDQSIMKPRGQVSVSAFAFLFSELVQYHMRKIDSITDLESRLEEAGYGIGLRVCELVACRERLTKRETKIVTMLQYVSQVVWKHLFNKTADNLERSVDATDEFMIYENEPITNKFVSVPPDFGSFNCASFIAGIIAGILDSSGFKCKVTAVLVQDEGEADKTVYLIKFAAEVMEREAKLHG